MQCPTDGSILVMTDRSGIEIDYCPTCRGVWLDRGELDKIIERSFAQAPQAAAPAAAPQQPRYDAPRRDDRRDERRDDRGFDQGYYKKRKKESWLSELFD